MPKLKKQCKVCEKEFTTYQNNCVCCSIKCSKLNPDRKKKGSISEEGKRNISKNHHDVSGKNNPNWKGGIAKGRTKFSNDHWKEIKVWRETIIAKANGQCVLCGSDKQLEVHHIIPFKETRKPALKLWNGVCLCKKCHIATDSYGGKGISLADKFAKQKIIVKFVPLCFQEYPTLGNYKNIGSETYFIITDTGNDFYNKLIFLHELVEQTLTEAKGIKEQTILRHDLEFEKLIKDGKVDSDSEPGEHKNSPYRQEHGLAEIVEKLMLNHLNRETFEEYNKKLFKIFE